MSLHGPAPPIGLVLVVRALQSRCHRFSLADKATGTTNEGQVSEMPSSPKSNLHVHVASVVDRTAEVAASGVCKMGPDEDPDDVICLGT